MQGLRRTICLGLTACLGATGASAARGDPWLEARGLPPGILLAQAVEPAPVPDWRQQAPGSAFVDTGDPAVPGAEELLEDTPNVFAWSRYQSGTVGDWSYRLFPDGSALVLPDDPRAAAAFILKCTAGEACQISDGESVIETVTATGAPRPDLPDPIDGRSLARYLAEWILAGTGTPPVAEAPPPPSAPPETAPVETAEAEAPDPEAAPPAPEGAPAAAIAADCIEPDPTYPDACAPPSLRAAEAARAPAPGPAAVAEAEEEDRLTLAERYDLSCSVSSGATLRYSDHDDQRTRYGKLRVSLGCGARLGERISLRVSLVRYPVPGQQAPWDPDFTYDLSYRVTDRLSLSYSSYTARFSGDGADVVSSLFDGSLRAALRLPPVSLPLGEGREMSCTLGMALPDPREGSATLGCAAPLTDKLRMGLTAYAYAAGEQEAWNPDFTYTASYQVNDRVQVSYANYGGNRWPWNPSEDGGPGPLGGSLTLSYRLSF